MMRGGCFKSGANRQNHKDNEDGRQAKAGNDNLTGAVTGGYASGRGMIEI